MKAGQRLTHMVPSPVARGMASSAAVTLSRTGGPAWTARRTIVARHLSRVLGPDAPPVHSRAMGRLVDESFGSYARYWAESLRIPGLDRDRLCDGIHYDGYDHIANGRLRGKGTILVLPHLGGWEWAGTQLAAIGHPVSVVVERLDNDDVYEWFVGFRQALGMQVIPAGAGAAAQCSKALADNHLLCLLADRIVGDTAGVDVDFFGEPVALPAGPATLALRTGATLLPCAVYFEDRTDAHLGVVHPAVDLSRTGRLREDVVRVTQTVARSFEDLIRAAPTQWHLMQPNWPSDFADL